MTKKSHVDVTVSATKCRSAGQPDSLSTPWLITAGTVSLPEGQSGDVMPQQLPVKLPPAWRNKIAMLKSRKSGQQGNAGASVAQGAV